MRTFGVCCASSSAVTGLNSDSDSTAGGRLSWSTAVSSFPKGPVSRKQGTALTLADSGEILQHNVLHVATISPSTSSCRHFARPDRLSQAQKPGRQGHATNDNKPLAA